MGIIINLLEAMEFRLQNDTLFLKEVERNGFPKWFWDEIISQKDGETQSWE